MKVLRSLLLAVFALLIVGVTGVLVGARFSDGPLGIIAGGPFTSGEWVTGPEPDWSFAHDVQEVQFQLLDPERSRTTWIVELGGKVYIASGYMTSWWGKLWKQWPHEAEKDGRIILRMGDKLYARELIRVSSGPMVAPILAELSRKYAGGVEMPVDAVTSGDLWLFELAPMT